MQKLLSFLLSGFRESGFLLSGSRESGFLVVFEKVGIEEMGFENFRGSGFRGTGSVPVLVSSTFRILVQIVLCLGPGVSVGLKML